MIVSSVGTSRSSFKAHAIFPFRWTGRSSGSDSRRNAQDQGEVGYPGESAGFCVDGAYGVGKE